MRSEIPVSIILPTYNRAALLPRSIASLLGQTYGDFELIVIDDGSEDDSAEIVAKFSDPRIRYVRRVKNGGLAGARNAGLDRARGAYIAFQDSDDEWLPEKLEQQVRELEAHPEVSVLYGDMLRMCADGSVLYLRSPTIMPGRLVNPETRYWQSYMLALQPALIRRACYDTFRFDEDLNAFEDMDFFLRVAQSQVFRHVPVPFVKYYETGGGITNDRAAELRCRCRLVRKYAGTLLTTEPIFLIKETMDVLLRRSLMPICLQHLTPLPDRNPA